jgi:hypothetical protein
MSMLKGLNKLIKFYYHTDICFRQKKNKILLAENFKILFDPSAEMVKKYGPWPLKC